MQPPPEIFLTRALKTQIRWSPGLTTAFIREEEEASNYGKDKNDHQMQAMNYK